MTTDATEATEPCRIPICNNPTILYNGRRRLFCLRHHRIMDALQILHEYGVSCPHCGHAPESVELVSELAEYLAE